MEIWVICQYYKPEPGAPSARLSGLARVWRQAGEQVSILTAVPNHPTGVIVESYRGKPKFFTETVEDIPVYRHWLYVTPNEGFLKKVLSHVSFAASVLFFNFRLKGRPRPRVIMVSSPSFFAAISAWILALRYRAAFVMEVRDLWPGIFVELGVMRRGFVFKLLEKIELFLYRRARAVVTVTRGFAKDIVERGIKGDKVFVITNGVSDDEYAAAGTLRKDGAADKLKNELQIHPLTKVVLYIGAHGISQALGQVVDVARMMMSRSDVLFLFVGEGAEKERLVKSAKGMPNVQFLPAQPKDRVWAFYALADICLVPLRDVPGFATFIPSKMFEIMASGTPIIGCVTGESAAILQQSGGALVVPPEDPEKLRAALLNLVDSGDRLEEMGHAGHDFVAKNYLHSTLGRRYLAVLRRVGLGKKSEKVEKQAA